MEFEKVTGVLDIYHALEHLNITGKLICGLGTREYEQWKEEGKWQLLWNGGQGIIQWLQEISQEISQEYLTEEMTKSLTNLGSLT